jgi:hypothetical protein
MDTSPTPTNTRPAGVLTCAFFRDGDSYDLKSAEAVHVNGITESVVRRTFGHVYESDGQLLSFLALPGKGSLTTHLSFDGTPEQQIRTLRLLAQRLQNLATDIEYGSD